MKLFQVIGGDPIDLYLYVKLSVLAFSQDFSPIRNLQPMESVRHCLVKSINGKLLDLLKIGLYLELWTKWADLRQDSRNSIE